MSTYAYPFSNFQQEQFVKAVWKILDHVNPDVRVTVDKLGKHVLIIAPPDQEAWIEQVLNEHGQSWTDAPTPAPDEGPPSVPGTPG